MPETFVRRLPLVPTLITLSAVVILLSLGMWQLERKAEKEQRLQQIEARKQSAPLSLSEIDTFSQNYQDFPIKLQGQLLVNALYYIDNKIVKGRPGYHVLIPLRTQQGTVLINFGWVAALGSREKLPDINIAPINQFSGTIRYPSVNPMIKETNPAQNALPMRLQQVDIALMQANLQFHGLLNNTEDSNTLMPFLVQLDADPQSGFIRNWTPVVMAPEKHLGYAVQWFGLGIACLTVYLLSVMRLSHSSSA